MTTIAVCGRVVGSRRPLFADFSIPLPPEILGDGGLTLRRLIDCVVRNQVREFRQRQEQSQFVRALTAREIAAGAGQGRIVSGGSEVPVQHVDEDEAVGVACQAFEDGMYLVVIDEQDIRELDRQIHIRPESIVTFIRLTLLTGG